jgi:phenylalanyl-tRNA synthetase beta chain
LFEIGRIFGVFTAAELPTEREALALVTTGGTVEGGHAGSSREVDFFDLKGALETAVEAMNLGPLTFTASQPKHLQPGQSALIVSSDGTLLGSIGKLSDSLASAYKFRQSVYLAELDLSSLLSSPEKFTQYHPLPRYPSVMRDVTLLLSRKTVLDDLLQAVKAQAIEDCRNVKLVGTYAGPGVPEDKRTVTLRIEYRSDEKTLRDEEIEERQQLLVRALCDAFSAEQR